MDWRSSGYRDHGDKPGQLQKNHYSISILEHNDLDHNSQENLLIAGMNLLPNITIPDVMILRI